MFVCSTAVKGHLLALFANVIWGSTFISTKVLLDDFSPTVVMFIRFLLAYIFMWCVLPQSFKFSGAKNEFKMLVAGFCGVTAYYQLENVALTYTYASNVGVIFAIIPFFVGVQAHFFFKGEEQLSRYFLSGFVVAMLGILLITFSGAKFLGLRPEGDLIAILGCIIWSFYAILVKRINIIGIKTILITRRIFFYALLLMLPCMYLWGGDINYQELARPKNYLNFLYLSLFASVLCYLSWNSAVKFIGAMATSAYIYVGPIVTVVLSVLLLDEKLTWISFIGMGLTMVGLLLSEWTSFRKLFLRIWVNNKS